MEKPDKKTGILMAAEKLFSEFGFEGTSTRQIAKESGANMAMINYYFGSKEGVFLEIMDARITTHKNLLKEISVLAISPKEKMMLLIEQYVNKILSNLCFHKMMYRELSLNQRPEMFTKIKAAIAQNRSVIEEIIESGVKAGDFKTIDVRMLISAIMGTSFIIAQQPDRVIDDPKFNINNTKHREELRLRVTHFLQDLVKSYLIIPKK